MSEEHKLQDEHAPETDAVKTDHAVPEVEAGETIEAVAVEAEDAVEAVAQDVAEVSEVIENVESSIIETVESAESEVAAEVDAVADGVVATADEASETVSEALGDATPEVQPEITAETVTISASDPAAETLGAASPLYATGSSTKGGKGGNETFEIIKTVAAALLIALVIRTVLFQPFTIPSASMEPNLYQGDYIVVSKWSYGYSKHALPFSPPLFSGRIMASEPKRGDIVVFKWPGDNKVDYIKRVIGLPGDTVQMINNQLYLNGQLVPDVETTAREVAGTFNPQPVIQLTETLPGGPSFTIQDFGPGNPLDNTERFTVPAGHYFMIGDNRDNSLDSRAPTTIGGVGLVPAENLVGKAEIILASWKPGASLWKPWTWFNVRGDRFFRSLH